MVQDEQAQSHAVATVRDPICGMELEPRQVFATRTIGGETVSFCSQRCVQRFDREHVRSATTGVAENEHLRRIELSIANNHALAHHRTG